MGTYKISHKATRDIDHIYEITITDFGLKQAKAYLTGMMSKFDTIALSPKLFPERREFFPPVRICPFEAHIIIYQILSYNKVEIIRVRHAHEDWL